ncbi:S-layer homology domain-containing protein [Ammoniphilus sp. 3BR4]|uniref:S-layer homology domain-containing protein n=1 Tax=Ammoniphilus sp. 3BR4 TaxID=3158265 RepID=UPI003466EBC4
MMKNWKGLLTMVLSISLLAPTTGLAFTDVGQREGHGKLLSLKNRGIIQGISAEKFAPHQQLTYAQAVTLIVKGLNLNIDHIRFVKEPKASDYYTSVPNDAWYANSFLVAHLNGMELDKNVKPNEYMTREQFADLLMKAALKTGDYMFIELYIMIQDEQSINPQFMNSIQKLLLTKIGELKDGEKFEPQLPLTREEAAIWIYNAIEFIENHKQK